MNLYPLIRKIHQLNQAIISTENIASQNKYREAIVSLENRISSVKESRKSSRYLEALFFPYSRILDEISLKKAVLTFDKVWFLDSLDKMSREVTLTYSNYLPIQKLRDSWNQIKVHYKFLEEQSLVSYYDTTLINKDFERSIAKNLIQDIKDSRVVELVPPNRKIWALQKSEFPFRHLSPEVSLSFGKYTKCDTLHHFGVDARLDKGAKVDLLKEAKYLFVDELHGKSIKLSQALQISLIEDISLFTDDFSSLNLMTHRIERITRTIGKESKLKSFNFNKAHLTFTILERILSDELLEKRTFKEIVEYKNECQELRFRLFNRIERINEKLLEKDDFYEGLKGIINSEIIPEIRTSQDEHITIYEKMFGEIAKASAKATSGSLASGGLIAAAFSIPLINALLVTSGIAASAILPTAIDAYLSQRKLRRSPWIFVLPYSKKF